MPYRSNEVGYGFVVKLAFVTHIPVPVPGTDQVPDIQYVHVRSKTVNHCPSRNLRSSFFTVQYCFACSIAVEMPGHMFIFSIDAGTIHSSVAATAHTPTGRRIHSAVFA